MLRVGLLFGGRSHEHTVSLRSAREVLSAMEGRYEVVFFGIDLEGNWRQFSAIPEGDFVERGAPVTSSLRELVDVVFPVMHGPFCEDGTVQGFLVCEGIPFVGAGVLGSAVGMDKDVSKRLLRDAGIAVSPFQTLYPGEEVDVSTLGLPLFVKPANAGSSVGISRVDRWEDLDAAIAMAFSYDQKVIVEEAVVDAREFEVSVLGNRDIETSLPAEVITDYVFYNYEAKCLDPNGERFVLPADLDAELICEMRELARQVMRILSMEGMARVDFLLGCEGKLYLNEVNTIPGFTKTSLYPKMWEASGISYPELIDRLIALALEDRQSPHMRGSEFTLSDTQERGRSFHQANG